MKIYFPDNTVIEMHFGAVTRGLCLKGQRPWLIIVNYKDLKEFLLRRGYITTMMYLQQLYTTVKIKGHVRTVHGDIKDYVQKLISK